MAEHTEREAVPPAGTDERFVGYGILGLQFTSGDVLALRRWSASSIGPSYSSVWHRRPDGRWRIYSDAPERQACARYVSRAAPDNFTTRIRLDWLSPWQLRVTVVEAAIEWKVTFTDTLATRAFGLGMLMLPEAARHATTTLALMNAMAPLALGARGLRLMGEMPNGQRYRVAPSRVLRVRASRACWGGDELGDAQLGAPPARLGTLSLPMSGVFAFVSARFSDPAAHAP